MDKVPEIGDKVYIDGVYEGTVDGRYKDFFVIELTKGFYAENINGRTFVSLLITHPSNLYDHYDESLRI